MNTYNDYIVDALDQVSAWVIPEERFAQAVIDQARLMAGMHLEASSELEPCSPYEALRF